MASPDQIAAAATRSVGYDPAAALSVRVILQGPAPIGCLPTATLYANGEAFASKAGQGTQVKLPLTAALDPATTWTVRPAWESGGATGPPGPPAEVPVAAPVLRWVEVADGGVSIAWDNLPGPPYPTGGQVLLVGGGKTCAALVVGADEATCALVPALVEGVVYSATVAPVRGPAKGPASVAVSVPNVRTAIASTAYDGRALSVTWVGADPAGTTGCRVELLDGETVVGECRGTGGRAAWEVALDPAMAYEVRLRWLADRGSGPAGPPAPVLAATAAVSALKLTETAVEATIEPPAAVAGIASYVARLYRGERLLASSPGVAAAAAPVAAIPCAQAQGEGLSVRVQALGGDAAPTAAGPLGPSVPVVPVGPTIERAAVDGKNLELSWEMPAAPAGAIESTTIAVVPSAGDPATFAALPGTAATVPLADGFLDPTKSYTVRAVANCVLGPSAPGPAQALLSGAPALGSAGWDGERLLASWAWAVGEGGAGEARAYRLELFAGGVRRGQAVVAGLSASLTPDALLDATETLELAVSPLAPGTEFAGTRGPAPIWAAPELQQAEVVSGAAEVTLSWIPPAGAVTAYKAVFSSEGAPDAFANILTTTSPASVALPSLPADSFRWTRVALQAIGAIGAGPCSEALPILTAAPAVEDIAFDGSRIAVRARPVAGAVDGYQLKASWTAEELPSATPSATIAASPPAGAACFLAVVARRGGAVGPGDGANEGKGQQLVVAAPAIGDRACDGGALTIAVTPPAAPSPTVTGYGVELVRGGRVVAAAELPVPAPTQPLTLPVEPRADPAVAAAVRVRVRAGLCLGPAAEAPVLLAAPTVAQVEVGKGIEARVLGGALPAAGLTLQARLVVDGTPGAPVAVDAQGTATFELPQSGSAWAVAARAIYQGLTGPWSEEAGVPSAAPSLTAALYEDGQLLATWQGDPAATYLATVVAGGDELARARVRGTEATLRFDPPEAVAELVVRELSGVVAGPCASLELVTASLAATAVTAADQATVTLSWVAPKEGPTPTGFVPVLAWEGTTRVLAAEAAGKTSTSVPLAGVPAAAAVGVRAKAGVALGPLGDLAPIVLGQPADLELSCSGSELVASWSPPRDPRVDGAFVTLAVPQQEDEVTRVSGSVWRRPFKAGIEGATVAVAAAAGDGTGAPTDAAAAIVDVPSISSLSWDGTELSVGWAPVSQPAGVDGYLVTVTDRGEVVAARSVAGSPAKLTVRGLSADSAVTVAALAPGSAGPPSAPLAVPVAAPVPTGVAVDPVTGVATVSWAPLPGASAYTVEAYLDGEATESVQASGTEAKLATPPGAGQDLMVAVRAQTATPGLVLEGPYGPRHRALTTVPAIAGVVFDGGSATVEWIPVAAATGYEVAVVGAGIATPAASSSAPAGATSLRLATALTNLGVEYEVVVQAQNGADTGVRASAPLFRPALVAQASEGTPRLLPAKTLDLAAAPTPVIVYLPPLGTAPLGSLPIEPPQAGTSEAPFKLAANPDPASAATLPYTLTIGAGALRFDANRLSLAATYSALLGAAEAAGAGPQGIFVLQQAISRLMPQTFEETLYYAYGLSASRGCVDLRPGTILRVAAAGFDLTAVDSAPPPASWSSGYAPGGAVDLAIGDYFEGDGGDEGRWLVGFDAFLAWLAANGILKVQAPEAPKTELDGSGSSADVVETGGADAADLFFAAFRNPYYRLLIPAEVQSANAPAVSRTGRQFTIASAPEWAQIDAQPAGSKVRVAYFRGRAVLKPCIRVEIDGAEQVVPVGTTVGNVLDGLGRRPPPTARPLAGLRLERSLGPAVLDPGAAHDVGASTRVHLDWDGLVTWAAGRSALSLPLLHGDRLSVGEGA